MKCCCMCTRELLITGYALLTWVKYLALHKSSITLNTVFIRDASLIAI